MEEGSQADVKGLKAVRLAPVLATFRLQVQLRCGLSYVRWRNLYPTTLGSILHQADVLRKPITRDRVDKYYVQLENWTRSGEIVVRGVDTGFIVNPLRLLIIYSLRYT
jgi:hypothetical protein